MADGKNFGIISSVVKAKTSSPEVYKIMWIIQNFQNQFSEAEEFKESPHFFIGADKKDEWSLDVYLNGFDENPLENTSEFITVRAWLSTDTCEYKQNRNIVAEFALLDRDGKKHYIETVTVQDEVGGVIPNYVRKNNLLSNAEQMLPNNELRILCHIFYLSSVDENDEEIDETSCSRNVQLEGFNKLLNNEKYSDFKLIVQEKVFCVHRAILAVKSPVFEAMFDSKMREASEGKVHIDDIEPKVMEKLLGFVYTGDIQFEDVIDRVLVAAEKYQFSSLKMLCEKELVKNLSVDNVYDILQLADQNNALILRKKAVQFFDEHLMELVAPEDFTTSIDALPSGVKTDIIRIMAQKRC